jgi:glycosyltransferase involved in cell wall biosynthesis
VKADDPVALANGIKQALRPTSKKLAERALADVHQYTWQKRAGKILNFIYGQ